jgi:hypothetical protein
MEEDAEAGRPFIAALAVSKARGGSPAEGFFDCARRLGRFTGDSNGVDARSFHMTELNAALKFSGGVTGTVSMQQLGRVIRVLHEAKCLTLMGWQDGIPRTGKPFALPQRVCLGVLLVDALFLRPKEDAELSLREGAAEPTLPR